jgi:hypothetical protein
MNSKDFKYICASCSDERQVIFDVADSDHDNADLCESRCIIWKTFQFYGISDGLPEDELDEILSKCYEGVFDEAVKLGQLSGCLILCKQMIDEGYDPWDICEGAHGDLSYAIDALAADGEPLSEDGEPYQNLFYIHAFLLEDEYNKTALKSRILCELPKLLQRFYHVEPELLAFYPEPPEHEVLEELLDEGSRYNRLNSIADEKMKTAISSITITDEDSGKIMKFSDKYDFSPDDLDYLHEMFRRKNVYPDSTRFLEEYIFLRGNGFSEAGKSGLLYIVTDDVIFL